MSAYWRPIAAMAPEPSRARAAAVVLAAIGCVLTLAAYLLDRHVAPSRGLVRTFYAAPDFQGAPLSSERVSAVDLAFLVEDPELPRQSFSIRWEGFWHVPDGGPIRFFTRADDRLELFADDERVLVRDRGDGPRMTAHTLELTPGVRQIRLDYVQRDGIARLVLEWEPPGGARGRFDAAALFAEAPSAELVRLAGQLEWLWWIVRAVWAAALALAAALSLAPLARVWRRADPIRRAWRAGTDAARSPAAWALAAIVLLAILMRVAILWASVTRPGFVWIDPDNYWAHARRFVEDGPWQWTPDAVHFQWGFFKAPLYAMLLSLFVPLGESARWTVAVGQAMLGSVSLVGVFVIGRLVHSARAGAIAMGGLAVFLTQSSRLVAFWQEHVYVPLVTVSLACLAYACTRTSSPARMRFACAGAVFGLAALARSMPLYFVPVACGLWLASGPDRRDRAGEAAAMILAFALVVLPYSILISSSTGRVVPIENVGSYMILRDDPAGRRAPGLARTLDLLGRQLAQSPSAFAGEKVSVLLRGNFRPPMDGPLGVWLQTFGPVEARWQAAALEWGARLIGDVPFVMASVLAPIGWALARQRPLAAILGSWVVVHLALSALAGYGGHRFREPIEPLLFVFAAVVLAGGWRRPGRGALAAGVAMSMAVAVPLADRLDDALNVRVATAPRAEAGREGT